MCSDDAKPVGRSEIVGEELRRQGKRMTSQRALLLRIIGESDEHLGAEEIHRRARAQGARISLATVYRTLRVLAEMGLVREHHFDEEHHHYERAAGEHYHLVCLGCGRVTESWPADGGRRLRQVAEESGFELVQARLELHGYCSLCLAAREDSAASR